MRIGIDFDNTIVNYDGVFYNTALELGWLGDITKDISVGKSKSAVKNILVGQGKEELWTRLQGIVYGSTIADALPYKGLEESLDKLKLIGLELYVVSHKTRYPILGEKLDFHQAARSWIKSNALGSYFSDYYFCPEKDKKIAKIVELNVAWFIDDLMPILTAKSFPQATNKIHFSPDENNLVVKLEDGFYRASEWADIVDIILVNS